MRSFLPREHALWVQFVLPLLVALACDKPNIPSLLLTGFAISYFLMHEPAVWALGYRGEEMRREHGWRARRWVFILGLVAIGCLGAAFFLGVQRLRLALIGPSAFAVLTALLTIRHEEKTFWGELVTAVTLSGLAFPLMIAEGLPLSIAMQSWIAWVFGFVTSSVAVRTVAEKVDRDDARRRAIAWLTVLTVGGGLGLALGVTLGFVPALPMMIASWVFAWWQPGPRRKGVMRWSLTFSAVMTGGALLWLTRG